MKPDLSSPQAISEMQERIQILRAQIAAHPFVRGLTKEQLATLADCAMETQFKQGELVFREGEFANRFYLIIEGEVVLESGVNGGATPIGTIGTNEVLGWSWLFPPYYWHFSARALKPTRAIFFYGTWLREHCEHDHDLGYELIKRMAEVMIQRLQSTRQQLADVRALAPSPGANSSVLSTTTKETEHEKP